MRKKTRIISFKKKAGCGQYEGTGGVLIEYTRGGEDIATVTPNEMEKAYEEFTTNFKKWAPDGIIDINLETLCEMGLLNREDVDEEEPDDVTQYFHVVETPDKITLHNEKFAIWIVPKMVNDVPTTHTYISQVQKEKPQLELVYSTSGVYNTPKFILKVLQHFLIDVIDTEAIISNIGDKES